MSTADNTATEKQDVYQRVTSQIINAIEQGVSNWRMPWHTSGKFAFSPINVTSKKPYRGINTAPQVRQGHLDIAHGHLGRSMAE